MNALPIKDHPLVNEIRAKLSDGSLSIGCPMTPHEWTPSDYARLHSACERVKQLRQEPATKLP